MSLSLDCFFGLFKQNIPAPRLPLSFAGQPLGFFVERASRGPGGTPGIQLRTAGAYSPASVRPPATFTDLVNLQVSLQLMLRNPGPGQRISRVGVLYADAFVGHPDLFGLMFDQGFPGPQEPPIFSAVPREGCAVFLSAIVRNRPNPQDFQLETLFTTAHELSHVFNLWHVPELSFLTISDVRVPPFGVQAYRYAAEHANFLRNMDRPEVFPGGTPFGVRGLLGPPDNNSQNAAQSGRVRITLSTNVDEFWRFEPVELTIRIAPASRRTNARPIVLPDTVDPGYDSFDVWITEPDGIRRRYRSPARFCTNAGTIRISTARPFTRDIAIFGQAGGYTFRKTGIHRLLATMLLPDGRLARSNVLEVFVKEERPGSAEYERLHAALTKRSTAQLLFYKSVGRSRRAVDQALEHIGSVRSPKVRASVRYASAVALSKRPAFRRDRSSKRRAVALLKSALDSGKLGQHQTRKAAECVDEFGA